MFSIEAYFDGCVEPRNPGGHGSYGALIKVGGEVFWSEGKYIGTGRNMTNNVAEYSGAIAVLEKLQHLPGVAIIRGDSKLVVNQLGGRWRVRGGSYVPYYRKAKVLARELKGRIRFEWIPRAQNGECDELSKGVLRAMGVKFRIQPE